MSDIRIPGGDAGASAAIGLGAVSGSGAAGAVHGKKVGEHPAPPPPPPLSGAEGARPLMGSKMTPDQLEAAKAALTELMSDGNELQAVLTNAILMILQSLFLLRETQDTADVIEINTQVSEMKTAASKIDDEAAWTIAGAAVLGGFEGGASIGGFGAGMEAGRQSLGAGGGINLKLGGGNAKRDWIHMVGGGENAH